MRCQARALLASSARNLSRASSTLHWLRLAALRKVNEMSRLRCLGYGAIEGLYCTILVFLGEHSAKQNASRSSALRVKSLKTETAAAFQLSMMLRLFHPYRRHAK